MSTLTNHFNRKERNSKQFVFRQLHPLRKPFAFFALNIVKIYLQNRTYMPIFVT